jgi:uncharacterized protein (DUF1778 family)
MTKKNVQINLEMTETERQALAECASFAGRTVDEFVRKAVEKQIDKEKHRQLRRKLERG